MRNAHMLTGLFAAATLLMYGVSSVQMVHRSWWPWSFQVTERTVTLPARLADGRAAGRALMESHGVRGDLIQMAETEEGFRLRITRPGTETEAAYRSGSGETRVKERRADFGGMLVALHHARGLHHEPAAYNLWGALVGLVSVGLMILGSTGIYLWFHIHKERRAGAVILAASLGFSLTLIVSIRMAQ